MSNVCLVRAAATLPMSVGLLVLSGISALSAQTTPANLHDKFQVNLSATGIIVNSNIRIDGDDGTGTEIDAEDDLGLAKRKLQPRAALRWRPGRRHELEVGYQFARRTGEKTLQRTIDFGDSTFIVGTNVQSKLNTDQAFLIYRFAVHASERRQLGVGLGTGALLVNTELDADLTNGGQNDFTQGKKVTAPVGSLGLYGRFLVGDRWYVEADARYLTVIIDRFDVQVLEAGAAARYFLSPGLALEVGYGLSDIVLDVGRKDVGADGEALEGGRIEYSLQNLRLGVVWVPRT